jgi:hypothetical protein
MPRNDRVPLQGNAAPAPKRARARQPRPPSTWTRSSPRLWWMIFRLRKFFHAMTGKIFHNQKITHDYVIAGLSRRLIAPGVIEQCPGDLPAMRRGREVAVPLPRAARRVSGTPQLQERPQRESGQPVAMGQRRMRRDEWLYQRSGIHAIHSAAPSRPDDGHTGITEWPAPPAAVPASEIRRVISGNPPWHVNSGLRYAHQRSFLILRLPAEALP